MLKWVTLFLTLYTINIFAEEKYDFFVDKSLLCSPREVIVNKLEQEGWVAAIRIQQPSKFWTYIYFLEDIYSPGRVGKMRIYEFEPTNNTACLIAEDNGNVEFNSSFWDKFFLGKNNGQII
jgi:hypothetical protein